MEQHSRHQCLIYNGSPSVHLRALAALTRQKLAENYRCLYLNSPTMVAGMRSYLCAAEVDVAREVAKNSLVLTSDQDHLADGHFSAGRMLQALDEAVSQSLKDGYKGLWATGDMSWELGPKADFSRLLDYEHRLEKYFHSQPALSGVCQYHADTLPPEAVEHGRVSHRSFFVNETLSRVNPHYVAPLAMS